MTFDVYLESFNSSLNLFEENMKKINTFFEYTMSQHDITLDQIEVKVMEESGTESDLVALYEAAAEETNSRIRKILEKIIKSFKEFIDRVSNQFTEWSNKAQMNKVVSAANKAMKKHPELRKRTVKLRDYTEEYKSLFSAEGRLTMLDLEYSAGVKSYDEITSVVNKIIETTEAKFDEKYVEMTLSDVTREMTFATNGYNKSLETAKKVIKRLNKVKNDKTIDDGYIVIARAEISIIKKEIVLMNTQMKGIISKLKSSIKPSYGPSEDRSVGESTNTETGMNEDPVTESARTIDDIMNEIDELIHV